MSVFDDYVDEMPEEFEAFAAGVRAVATRMPEPSRALADLLLTGVSSPQPKRSTFMKVKTYLAGLGMAAKIMLGAGVAAAATTGAGAAGVLPDSVQHVVAATVDSVTPFNLPDPASDKGTQAAGDNANNNAENHDNHTNSGEPPTTIANHDEHHNGDNNNGGGVITDPVTTTTTVHHEEHNGGTNGGTTTEHPTTTTTMHEEHHDTTTTVPTTPTTTANHDGDNNNPESLSITCSSTHEPNTIHCHWTPSTNPEHARYALLRINNQNTEGRVVWSTETGLEYTDTTVTMGWGYGYRVVSLRSDGTTESHSNIFTIPCC